MGGQGTWGKGHLYLCFCPFHASIGFIFSDWCVFSLNILKNYDYELIDWVGQVEQEKILVSIMTEELVYTS